MISEIDLNYFVELAKSLHLTRAAERLGVTQPTLSHSLARIEKAIGAKLFIRTKKGLLLTRSGELLRQDSQVLIEKWKKLEQAIQNEQSTPSGEIRLGCHPSVALYTLPNWVPAFLEKYPDVTFDFHHGLSRIMVDDVLAHRLDVAFAINPIKHPDLILKEIVKDEVTLWSSDKNKNKDVLFADPSLLQSQELFKKIKKMNLNFKRIQSSSHLEVIKSLVLAGAGSAVLPSRVFSEEEKKKIHKVRGAPSIQDTLYLVYRPEFRSMLKGKLFIDIVNSHAI